MKCSPVQQLICLHQEMKQLQQPISSGLLMLIDSLKYQLNLIPNSFLILLRRYYTWVTCTGNVQEVPKDTNLGGRPKAGDILSPEIWFSQQRWKRFGHPESIIPDETIWWSFSIWRRQHHCIGAPLARQELISSLKFNKKLSDIELIEIDKPIKYTQASLAESRKVYKI